MVPLQKNEKISTNLVGTHSGSRSVKPISKQIFGFCRHSQTLCIAMCRSCFNRASLIQIVLNCSKCRTWQLTNDEGNPCTETVHGFGRKGLKTQSCVNQSSANQVESNHFFMTQMIGRYWKTICIRICALRFQEIDATLGTCTSCMPHIRIRMPPSRSRANIQI